MTGDNKGTPGEGTDYMVRIKFIPSEKQADIPAGSTLLEAAGSAAVQIQAACGGKGTCGKCRARIVVGDPGPTTSLESEHLSVSELEAGWVLACQRRPRQNLVVFLQEVTGSSLRKAGLKPWITEVKADPVVEKIYISMDPPSVGDQRPDFRRLTDSLPRTGIKAELKTLASLPRLMREGDFKVTAVVVGDRLVAVEPGDTSSRRYGMAFDIGTTTVAGLLVDLSNGEVMAARATTNPQAIFGADVISRIDYALKEAENLRQLQDKVLGAVNGISGALLKDAGVDKNQVYEAVFAGNTTMSHLLLGVDPGNLAVAPFIPAFSGPVKVEAADLGLFMHPAGNALIMPNIAGYVGSDTVAVMLAARIDRREDFCLAVDIGTNGELVLAGRGRILTCSTAAGPAFEGACIKHGMRAEEGAIETFCLDGGDVRMEVIGHTAPRGICGSGLIDAVAQLLKAGIIDPSGRFNDTDTLNGKVDPRLLPRLRPGQIGYEFVLAEGGSFSGGRDVAITQRDVRELQLAKGAIRAGIGVLMREMGISGEEISEVLLAGAFGSYIKKESALAIGLLPPIAPDRIIPVGNAAADGARMFLISRAERERGLSLARRAEHVELSMRSDFQEEFINSLYFPVDFL